MSDDKKAAKAPTWTEFSDITTFHGIRYIPSTMRCRGYVKIPVISVIISVNIFFSLQIQSARKQLVTCEVCIRDGLQFSYLDLGWSFPLVCFIHVVTDQLRKHKDEINTFLTFNIISFI